MTLRLLVLLFAVSSATLAIAEDPPSHRQTDAQATHTSHQLIEGKLATVFVAKSLYEQQPNKYFLARVRVVNRTDREIGVDLRSHRFCVHINQWSASERAERITIDESREIRRPFTADDRAKLVKAFRDDKLVRISPGRSVDYFCAFNGEERASVRAAVDRASGKFLILSMDGELRVTNGEDCEVLCCGDPGEADVAIPKPIPWEKVPKDGRVLEDRS